MNLQDYSRRVQPFQDRSLAPDHQLQCAALALHIEVADLTEHLTRNIEDRNYPLQPTVICVIGRLLFHVNTICSLVDTPLPDPRDFQVQSEDTVIARVMTIASVAGGVVSSAAQATIDKVAEERTVALPQFMQMLVSLLDELAMTAGITLNQAAAHNWEDVQAYRAVVEKATAAAPAAQPVSKHLH
jgi:hypothetical protein